jgi:hypothetical protein
MTLSGDRYRSTPKVCCATLATTALPRGAPLILNGGSEQFKLAR